MTPHGPQSFEAEGPYTVDSGIPRVSDLNIIAAIKERLKGCEGRRVRITVELTDDDYDWKVRLAERLKRGA